MSLTKEKIIKNTEKYFTTAKSKGFMPESLMTFLGEDFIKAPATTLTEYFNAFEGGLISHLLTVTKYAIGVNNSLPENERVDQDSLIKVCLLHQIGKAKMFVPETSEWHRTNQGKMYNFAKDNVSMRVGERSVFYALSHGVQLSDVEVAAILSHDKTDDKMAEFHNTRLGYLLKIGNTLAILNEQETK
jgi:hypothetical protein